MSKVELEITEGVTLSVDEYNKLTEDSRRMVQAVTRCAHAYGVIRHLCGGDFRDFNNLDKWLDGDPEFAFLDEKLAPGIAIVVSEKDKDWVCPIAHNEHHMTLGAFMQKVMDDWLEAHRPIDRKNLGLNIRQEERHDEHTRRFAGRARSRGTERR